MECLGMVLMDIFNKVSLLAGSDKFLPGNSR